MSGPNALVVHRPRRLRLVCWSTAVTVVALFTLVAIGLGNGPPSETRFELPDQIALVALSLLLAGGVLVFTRARVVADGRGVRVRNAFRETAVPWAVVVGVRLDDGNPWAYLDLQDDDVLAVLAVQANDGEPARAAVRGMRELLDRSRDVPPDAGGATSSGSPAG